MSRSSLDLLAALLAEGARSRRGARSLGPGAGIWTAHLRAGITGTGKLSQSRGWLLLCQGCGMAEQVLRAAAAAELPIRAALASGTGGASLLRLAQQAAELRPAPAMLLALHRPCSFAELLLFGLCRPRAVLLVTDTAEMLAQLQGPQVTPPSASQLARSLGLPVTRSPEQLVAAAALMQAGLRRRKGLVLGLAPRIDEAALLADSLGRAGLRRSGTPIGAVVRVTAPSSTKNARGADATVVVSASGELPWIRPAGSRVGIRATSDTLRALASLLETAPTAETSPVATRPSAARARRAGLMLDGWAAELGEVEVKALLALYGLRAPDERLTTSASAAAKAAAQVGFPVAVKAAGPGLCQRSGRGALRLDVEGAAAVRQAFRDVLDGCARIRPTPPLAGVLVSRMVPLPFALDVSLLWPPSPAGAPPVLLACRRRQEDEVVGLPCPLTASQAAWAASRILGAAATTGSRDRLAEWLRRLSSVAPDLAGRMRWLRLDTVSPPSKTDPPLIIDGAALQTASLRDPLGLRGGEPIAGSLHGH